ncbi:MULTISPECIES: PP2C family serine/threonine-protein phosphatase [Micromonospora]|uniref:Serine/threonine-protein phosphatase n=1 Tax=Micromonospora solifontis TaxID=2487138 RepID=A0ABX9WKY2_9ACTN|nr:MULTISPECIES: PP2C family serine/threonine-protein phosphatase [Micromonospora]NES14951.1 serine/threonine-protein phosphatase [Micromonospora sp. PPF5-17B]NES35126.1 serine/threonine-protein phosphatase [Micromonospora solifontis]NES55121.1 serine/threonine-protein phosphatase [Micromonospora sp. PPF5-6]RNM01113.1 serine/threonine-protein phosphatase [Micromonospora solifontis]
MFRRRPLDRPVEAARRLTVGWLGLEIAGGSVVGHRYPENFDVLHLDPELPLAGVADGMGDGEGSRVAGATAMSTFVDQVRGGWPAVDPAALRAATAEAQLRVRRAGAAVAGLTGCTLTAMVVEPETGQGWLVQLGDSRAYRLRDGLLELITVDHTMAWLGVVHGWWPADSPEAARARYQLLRYVGHPDKPEPDLLAVPLRAGDTWLLCTDGVSDQLDYHRLRDLLAARQDPARTAEALLAATLDEGGDDNATAVIVRVHPAVPTPR